MATTSTQTGPSGATLATQVLKSKHRVRRVISYVDYKATQLEDLPRLLESSDDNNESTNDLRS